MSVINDHNNNKRLRFDESSAFYQLSSSWGETYGERKKRIRKRNIFIILASIFPIAGVLLLAAGYKRYVNENTLLKREKEACVLLEKHYYPERTYEESSLDVIYMPTGGNGTGVYVLPANDTKTIEEQYVLILKTESNYVFSLLSKDFYGKVSPGDSLLVFYDNTFRKDLQKLVDQKVVGISLKSNIKKI